MHVRILGPVELESGGENIAASANQRMLIAVLAAHAGRVVSSDLLVESLWGGDQPQNPSAALQNLVSRVRTRLDPDDLAALVTRPPGYGFELSHTTVDRLEFEGLVASARSESDPTRAVELLRDALDLWRGPAYAQLADCDALRPDAVRLDEMRESAREQLLRLMVRLDPRATIPDLEAMVLAHPYRDGPHMLLIEALSRAERRRDALQAAGRFRKILTDELGLDPTAELRDLEHRILTDSLDTVTVVPSSDGLPDGRPNNLPPRRSSFVGRDEAIEDVTALLDAQPAVTLVGAGGTGKTSLAIEVARGAADRFADGAWVVDLAALGDDEQLVEHVGATLPFITPLSNADADPLAALAGQLRDRSVLVVLDNCEHVVEAAARLVDCLLDRAPAVRVLATSREPLRIQGEHVHRVDPLDVPEPDADVAAVLNSSAGRLLVDRIRAADSTFEVEESDASTMTAICRRLDGLPLALELAAARVPALGMADLAGRLDDRFSVLTNHQRSAVAHHRTLREAIDWSVDLLPDAERTLLARLSVFVGGFDLDAAEAVGEDPEQASIDVAGLLAVLVERSLVVSFRVDHLVRFRLLETIRQYSDEMLGERRRSVQRAHRDWYLRVAREAGDGFLAQTAQWSRRLRADFPNVRAAYQFSMENDEVSTALDLAASLRWSLFNTGHLYSEHRRWIEEALRAARRTETPSQVLGRGLVSAGSVALLEGRSDDALALLGEALELLESLGADLEIVWCEMWLGALYTDLAQNVEGVEHASRGLAAAEASESPAAIVYLANQHAENALAAGLLRHDAAQLDAARASLRRAIDVATRHGIEEGLVRAEHGMALLEAATDPVAGFRRCRSSLDRWRTLGGGLRLIIGLVASARAGAMAGEDQLALDLLVEAAEEMDRVGWRQAFGRLLETAAFLAHRRQLVDEAGVLAGGASVRYLTPRWLVLLPFEDEIASARATDPARWERAVDLGRTLDDDALAEVLRSVARSSGPGPHVGRLREQIQQQSAQEFVGRERELGLLRSWTAPAQRPAVVFVHGPAGVGKTALVDAFAAREPPGAVAVVACAELEPTPLGVLGALARLFGAPADAGAIGAALSSHRETRCIAFDGTERLRLVTSWLRSELLPHMPQTVTTVLVGRDRPTSSWLLAPGWHGLLAELPLGPLPPSDSRAMLQALSVPQPAIEPIARFARGNPLALRLGASVPGAVTGESPNALPLVVERLVDRFLEGLSADEVLVVEAVSMMRRVTIRDVAELAAADGIEGDVRDLWTRLRDLPFVSVTPEGLELHDVVREAVQRSVAARDPERSNRLRARAVRTVVARIDTQDPAWSRTADLLYLIRDSVVRDGFFPPESEPVPVEPGTIEDRPRIRAMIDHYENEHAARWTWRWLDNHPDGVRVAKSAGNEASAFLISIERADVDPWTLRSDPVACAWAADLDRRPVGAGDQALLVRRALAAPGDLAAAAIAALFVDAKRTYLELRPHLRRTYTVAGPEGGNEAMFERLGFRPLGPAVDIGGATYQPLVLDFGPGSVDGWLARLLEAELSSRGPVDSSSSGDTPAHELDVLTAREREVLTLVARGASNKEVAAALDISAKTVGRHLERTFMKLGVTNRAAATSIAVTHGLLR